MAISPSTGPQPWRFHMNSPSKTFFFGDSTPVGLDLGAARHTLRGGPAPGIASVGAGAAADRVENGVFHG